MARRIHSAYPMLLLAGVLMGAGMPASGASFDCKKASTAVEKTICASPELSELDTTLGVYYSQAMAKLAPDQRDELRRGQRTWLQTRNACAGTPEQLPGCLQSQLSHRVVEVGTITHKDTAALDAIIASIPYHPAQAAEGLRRYPMNELAAAWLVYLQRFEPGSGVTENEAEENRRQVIVALKEDSFPWSIWQDLQNDPAVSRDRVTLTLLRMMIERQQYQLFADQRPYVHCFVFSRQGEVAYESFGSLYGSTRDSFAPICAPQGDLFAQPAWKRLDDSLSEPLSTASQNEGTIRFASYADWSALSLKATASPRLFLQPGAAGKGQDPELTLRNWGADKQWPTKQRQQALAAIEPARQATSDWLQRERGFSVVDARQASREMVRQWLNVRLDFIGGPSEL